MLAGDPSRAALRAAEVIAKQIRGNPDLDSVGRAQLIDALARIIDREYLAGAIGESSSPELVPALVN